MACDFVLFRHLIFEARDLGPVFRAEIWRIIEEPACIRCWCEQEQADEEDVMFHCERVRMRIRPVRMMRTDLR